MIRKPLQLNEKRRLLKVKQPLSKRIIKRFLFIAVNLLYRVRYEGLEQIPDEGPLMVIANHTHLADVVAIHCVIDHQWVSWVGKKELFDIPFFGRFFYAMDGIPVNRDKADVATARGIIGAIRDRKIVGMFPQGTRVRYAELRKVRPRSGAAHFALKTNVPLLPVAVDGQFKLFHKVRIIFGPVFQLEKPPGRNKPDAAMLEEMSVMIMKRIFSLAGQSYDLDDKARKRSKPDSLPEKKSESEEQTDEDYRR